MTDPIVFVSHFEIREGMVEAYLRLQREIAVAIEADKPGTIVFVAHLDKSRSGVSVTHVFPDADAMDRHFEGSNERSQAASKVMVPTGWEIYGPASPAALETIRQAAAAGGVSLTLAPEYVAGFLRSMPVRPVGTD